MNIFNIINSIIEEGDGQEGFDVPSEKKSKKFFKKVVFPDSRVTNERGSTWAVEVKSPQVSDEWAINRAAAAQLRRLTSKLKQTSTDIHRLKKNHPPRISEYTPTSTDDIKVIPLKG